MASPTACAGSPFSTAATFPTPSPTSTRRSTLAPDFVPAYQNRGNAWYARGNFGQAIADYDTAIRLDPNSPSAYVNRAAVRRDLGYVEGALQDYQKAIALDANQGDRL